MSRNPARCNASCDSGVAPFAIQQAAANERTRVAAEIERQALVAPGEGGTLFAGGIESDRIASSDGQRGKLSIAEPRWRIGVRLRSSVTAAS